MHDGDPYVIELAARLSGGFFCTREIPLNTGVDFIGCAIKVALGESVTADELTPRGFTPVVQRYAFPKPGRVVSIAGAEEARKVEGIAEVVVTAKPGDVIPPAGDKRAVGGDGARHRRNARAGAGGGQRRTVAAQDRRRMNAPLLARETLAATASLKLFALFHLNLAFSSIEEEQRGEVIARCYWPLLKLAEAHGPIGIEATGFTLEEIAARDPAWIAKARALIASGKVELIGSGYAQIIAPLVPARVTEGTCASAMNVTSGCSEAARRSRW